MAKMINTKYGYVTPQEAEMDAQLDKWIERCTKHKLKCNKCKTNKVVKGHDEWLKDGEWS
ncbi:hypothetical protein ACA583_07730 [Lactiplantibacillus plantarum]|uniref:hypothetical protein n=1 Tax=Lactiplantibacillus plantarum TaxID=1590 RepID=UPI0026576EAE|nr:hypothetical protein [Lactiplantibacillus plantarum]MDN7030549.1 hypothetical protein [Lactiplantibacillus plantarum]